MEGGLRKPGATSRRSTVSLMLMMHVDQSRHTVRTLLSSKKGAKQRSATVCGCPADEDGTAQGLMGLFSAAKMSLAGIAAVGSTFNLSKEGKFVPSMAGTSTSDLCERFHGKFDTNLPS